MLKLSMFFFISENYTHLILGIFMAVLTVAVIVLVFTLYRSDWKI